MADLVRRFIKLSWCAAVLRPGDCGAQSTKMLRQQVMGQQTQQKQHPAVVLTFTNPINGSSVHGPSIGLHYKLYTSRGSGRELTSPEIEDLATATTMCFQLQGFRHKTEICAPLAVATVTIRDALPAKWHTVTATIKHTTTGMVWEESGDRVTVLNGLDGHGVLDMCGESACLDTSDMRSAYFGYIYRSDLRR